MPEAPSRRRGKYARLMCLGCRERRIRCELPADVEVPDSGELRTVQTPCYRCTRLGIPCVVRQTVLGRPGPGIAPDAAVEDQPKSVQEDRQRPSSVVQSARHGHLGQDGATCVSPSSTSLSNSKVRIVPLRRPPAPAHAAASNKDEEFLNNSERHASETKRKRASKPKVKTGCQTCKIRRVKCDEGKPSCVKCTSTGRKCDGYIAALPRKHKTSTSSALVGFCQTPGPSKGLSSSPLKSTSSEVRALEYFCVKTAPSLGMYFDADFWSRFIVQASVAEPALRHAMIAVGVFAEQRQLLDIDEVLFLRADSAATRNDAPMSVPIRTRITDTHDQVALVNYNKSIGLLAKHMTSTHGTIDVILLACILFVCVEFLRGDGDAGLRHFSGGMLIITSSILGAEAPVSSRTTVDLVKTKMLPIFNRLEMLNILWGNSASWPYPVSLQKAIPETFHSLNHVRDSMVHLMNLSLRFINSNELLKYEPSTLPPSAFNEQAALLAHLELWHCRFLAYQAAHPSKPSPSEQYATNVLHIHRITAYTWVSIALDPFETAHDVHIPAHDEAVTLAEQLSAIAATDSQRARYSNTFLLDVELIGPMNWISIKCRDPSIRRRSIAVQRGTHRREGLWHSRMTAAVAERVVAVEEAGLGDGQGLPSESARVHHSLWKVETGVGPSGNVLTLRTKPWGVFGEWRVWEEEISVME